MELIKPTERTTVALFNFAFRCRAVLITAILGIWSYPSLPGSDANLVDGGQCPVRPRLNAWSVHD